MNTLIACLKSVLNNDVHRLISHYSDVEVAVNPTGGWSEGAYDRHYAWPCFVKSRNIMASFKERYSQKRYIEAGYTVIPFLQDSHHSWKKIGLIHHPILWIKEAIAQRYFTTSGDSTSSLPSSVSDYAKLWNMMTYTIITSCKPVFRIEDVFFDPTDFLRCLHKDVDTSDHPQFEPLKVEYLGVEHAWLYVEELASQLGYTKTGMVEDFKSSPSISRSVVCDTSPVSVIIAARNYGIYLKDAIQSALRQSILPLEIIYSDDASTDNSVDVARSFPTVMVITGDKQRGVCEARNRACQIANGKYLLHLDGDDIFPYQYIEHKLDAIKRAPDSDFVFSAAQAFGNNSNDYWDTPKWSFKKLWNGNYVNTSTLYKRSAFMEVGMWRETIGTGWDWDLAMRMGAAGKKGVRDPIGFLLYRHHEKSVSQEQMLLDGDSEFEVDRFKFLMRNVHCQTQISCILSGRVLGLFPKWMDAMARNVTLFREEMLKEGVYNQFGRIEVKRPNLVFLHTGPKEQRIHINKVIEQYTDHFENISVRSSRWENVYTNEEERRHNVAVFMAKSCNTLLETDDQLVWFVEDDIIPDDMAMCRLNRAILGSPIPLFAAGGVYRNRHDPLHLIAHDWANLNDMGDVVDHTGPLEHDTMVDMTGTGCLMIFRPFAQHKFGNQVRGVPAHDWNWCLRLRKYKGGHLPPPKILLLKNVPCKHFLDEKTFVEP